MRRCPCLLPLAFCALTSVAQGQVSVPEHPDPFLNSLEMRFVRVSGVSPWVSIFETRVRDYAAFVADTGHTWKSPDFEQSPNDPAVMVSWRDAVAFCEWLSAREGKTYRLPTDREWSILAGLGEIEDPMVPAFQQPQEEAVFPWGRTPISAQSGNYCDGAFGKKYGETYDAKWLEGINDGYAATAPVGKFPALKNGLHDLAGNVWEWVDGWYDPEKQHFRIVRGGSWRTGPSHRLSASFRGPDSPSVRLDSVGFRVVVERPLENPS